jgi:ankyrin repeat protein
VYATRRAASSDAAHSLYRAASHVRTDESPPALAVRATPTDTPLFQAVFSHKLNMVHMLLEAGADPRLRNRQGYNALDAAAYTGCTQCARMLLDSGVNPHVVGRDGYIAMHRALWGDDDAHTETAEARGSRTGRDPPTHTPYHSPSSHTTHHTHATQAQIHMAAHTNV